MGDFLCCLRFILLLIPQIFTDFVYSNIRAPLCYLWETPSHPISVFICAICGRFPLLLEIYSPTDSTDFHRFYISQYPCSSVLSVGDTICSLILIFPQMPWIITDLSIPHPCASVLSMGATICSLILILPQMPRIITDLYIPHPCSSVLSVGATICSLILFSRRCHGLSDFLDYGFF